MSALSSEPSSAPSSAPSYVGRFAPSPTGPLHFGSLTSALASFIHARQNKGKWLVRMEDIDPPREVAGASDQILQQLDDHGLHWDDAVLYQSSRLDSYKQALDNLWNQGLVYHCQCNRQRINSLGGVYDGQCRHLQFSASGNATRVIINNPDRKISFVDQIMGTYQQQLSTQAGDFVIQRRDQLFSYQLAVVVDDQFQAISHIVRGEDLLDSTPRQLYLQQCLGYNQPTYSHLPLVLNSQGQKLSKQNLATGLRAGNESQNLWQALRWLQQSPPEPLKWQSVSDILTWAINHWDSRILAENPQNALVPDGY